MLVVHKRSHARNLMDVEPRAAAVITTVQRMVRAVRAAMKPDGVFVAQFNGAAAGQTIFHLHFHVIPRWDGVPLGRHGGRRDGRHRRAAGAGRADRPRNRVRPA